MFPFEVANEGEDGAVVGRTDVDGVVPVVAGRRGTRRRRRRRRRRAKCGRGRRNRRRFDGARDDDRHVKRAGERLKRRYRQVTRDAQHREDAASDRQTFYNRTRQLRSSYMKFWGFCR